MRTKKGIKELITGIIIGEGLIMTDLEENAVNRIIEALTEENNLFIPDVNHQRELLKRFADSFNKSDKNEGWIYEVDIDDYME